MKRVAERARASKASLYRRWPSKVELVVTALYDLLPDPADAAATGSLRGDLLVLFRDAAAVFIGPAGTALRGLVGDALRDPELAAQIPHLHPRQRPTGDAQRGPTSRRARKARRSSRSPRGSWRPGWC
jgi:AcrR family transcriptional regulator